MFLPAARRRSLLVALAAVLASLAVRTARADPPPCPIAAIPRGVADLHVDLPYQVRYRDRALDLAQPAPGAQVTAQSLRDGCVRLMVLSIYTHTPGGALAGHTRAELMAVLAAADQIVAANPALFAGPDAPVRVVYGIEGAHALAGAPEQVPALVARGVRLFGLVHARHNALADSATDRGAPAGGLTPEGERFVRAVYAAGALVDVSHASDAAFDAVARIARELGRPLVATHSNARALAPHARNLTDAQLRAIAASGGIAGLNFHAPFVRGGARAQVADVVRQAQHMITVMGAAHVAIGSDFDGGIRPARGLANHAALGALVGALLGAGVAAGDVRAIAGENAMRVLGGRRAAAGGGGNGNGNGNEGGSGGRVGHGLGHGLGHGGR